MFRHFFTRRDSPTPPSVAEGSRIYAVGDIHGRADLLERMHGLVLKDSLSFRGQRRVVVYLGDYVDRGLQSREAVDLLLDQPLPWFERIHLRGNHEQTLLDFLVDPGVGYDWLTYGGDATLYSYGVAVEGPRTSARVMARLQEAFRNALPQRHLDFFTGLGLTHIEGGYLFTHAGVRPGVPLENQKARDLLWIRDAFLDSDASLGRMVVHGHTITRQPEIRCNRIGIDTGAFDTGHLTCLVLEGTERHFLST